jgi:DNA helicase-2/ATP-dependent DNA helicase PcrA
VANRTNLRHLADLDPRQREAATHPDGRLLVIAGPGAGKTRTLAARIAHLVHVRGIDPATVVAFTFSRRAAAELRGRVMRNDVSSSPVGPSDPGAGSESGERLGRQAPAAGRAPSIWAGTIHAFGVRVLRHGGSSLFGRRPDFTIHDDDDTERTVRRVLETLGARPGRQRQTDAEESSDERSRPEDPVGIASREISLVKRGAISPSDSRVELDSVSIGNVFKAYEESLRNANAFDFDDLVALAARALEVDRPLRDRVRARVRHLLIDEFQDTDAAQVRLIQALDPPDVCVVADPMQSIYGFRGASPNVVGWFTQRWPDASVIRLDRNYRSTARIVAVAQRIRDAGQPTGDDRTRLRQWTRAGAGDPVRTWSTSQPEREARLIANEVAERLAGGTRPSEIAILVRTRAQLRQIEAVLVELDTVPYEIVGGAPFFDRAEVRDILAYLRVGASPDDASAFWRIVNVPRRGLGPAAMIAIGRETVSAEAASRAPEAAMRRLTARDRLPDGAFDLLATIDEVRARVASKASLAETVRFIVQATGYLQHLERAHPQDAVHRAARIETLATLADRFDDARRFLDDAILATAVDAPQATDGRVRVSTIHGSKGAEYDHVYVAGCEEGILPVSMSEPSRARRAPTGSEAQVAPMLGPENQLLRPTGPRERSIPTPSMPSGQTIDLAEERRIFYVAVTRARQSLTLSCASFRHNRRSRPSRFLDEVGANLLLRCEPGTGVRIPRTSQRTSTGTLPQDAGPDRDA